MAEPDFHSTHRPGRQMHQGIRIHPDFPVPSRIEIFTPRTWGDKATKVSDGGRNTAWYLDTPWGEAVLRHYHRGGLIGRFVDERYLWVSEEITRSFAEFALLNEMHAQGLPVPRAMAASYQRRGVTYRAAIMTERLRNTISLAQAISQAGPASIKLIEPVSAAIRQLHDANVYHADLNAHNILVDDVQKIWLIDFDKSSRRNMTAALRQQSLERLGRSLQKLLGEQGVIFSGQLQQQYKQS
ncbi:3-deoxy-D-manno-octulosonic acid kinase [Advenella mimigardefordensis]|uniref:3-deoxy-D-manno-octulosonic acid kinase n=1 Tax=Advenella mimigardefordensis (strain DSM 17166 / LMG 22922 / DPN7) TaxID=1247726 RepID=W0PDR0_ADVMD|nr:3-deoxy-D-manno-octulosonic acid kinase [Advenella mimigardefordensis]AHG63597.1 3-deoxy-D-manno-octulosonic acid kinase [Advenella mimigardefordensis DPN7]